MITYLTILLFQYNYNEKNKFGNVMVYVIMNINQVFSIVYRLKSGLKNMSGNCQIVFDRSVLGILLFTRLSNRCKNVWCMTIVFFFQLLRKKARFLLDDSFVDGRRNGSSAEPHLFRRLGGRFSANKNQNVVTG